jgi:hypothetical protein
MALQPRLDEQRLRPQRPVQRRRLRAPETASGGLSRGAHLCVRRSGPQSLTASGENRPRYDRMRRGALLPKSNHKYHIGVETTCSAGDSFNAFKGAGVSAPLAPAAREGYTRNVGLAGGNPIYQYVNSRSMTIVNTTLPGHIFYPGTVTIQVTSNGWGGSNIDITGTGSGNDSLLNDLVGYAFFGGQASLMGMGCAAQSGAFSGQ